MENLEYFKKKFENNEYKIIKKNNLPFQSGEIQNVGLRFYLYKKFEDDPDTREANNIEEFCELEKYYEENDDFGEWTCHDVDNHIRFSIDNNIFELFDYYDGGSIEMGFVIKLPNNGADEDYVDENIYPNEIFKFVKNKLVKYD